MLTDRLLLYRYLRVWILPIMVLAVLATGLVAALPRGGRPTSAKWSGGHHDTPVRIEPLITLPRAVEQDALRVAIRRLDTYRPETVSDYLHVARLFGPAAPLRSAGAMCEAEVVDLLLDHQKSQSRFGGEPLLIDTRTGVRCQVNGRGDTKEQPERQTHEDQLLAVLGELGVPLSRPLSTQNGTRTVASLLDDAMAHFDLEQREIEWSVLAFTLYLPPRTSWTDKFGGTMTFDKLAGALIAQPFTEGRACAGTHLLYTLVVLMRVDGQIPILSLPVRQRVRSHLASMVGQAITTQSTDGSWSSRWYDESEAAGDSPAPDWTRVLATGHMAEWLIMLPEDLLPPRDCFLRAARWLDDRLGKATEKEIVQYYCPYSHAGRFLWMLSQAAGRTSGARESNGGASPRDRSQPVGGSGADRIDSRREPRSPSKRASG